MNNVYIDFAVDSLDIKLSNKVMSKIPTGNKNYIIARFTFVPDWRGLEKEAIFMKKGYIQQVALVNDMCVIPEEFFYEVGQLTVSVVASERRTVNKAIVEVVLSGYDESISPPIPPTPQYTYIKSAGENRISQLREEEGSFEFLTNDWQKINYEGLDSLPSIEGTAIKGTLTAEDLGLATKEDIGDINAILDIINRTVID